MDLLLRVLFTIGVLLATPFAALYGAATALVGAVQGGCLLIWDAWK